MSVFIVAALLLGASGLLGQDLLCRSVTYMRNARFPASLVPLHLCLKKKKKDLSFVVLGIEPRPRAQADVLPQSCVPSLLLRIATLDISCSLSSVRQQSVLSEMAESLSIHPLSFKSEPYSLWIPGVPSLQQVHTQTHRRTVFLGRGFSLLIPDLQDGGLTAGLFRTPEVRREGKLM